jgi:diketogulonate reductase-like aldo/keto reductase
MMLSLLLLPVLSLSVDVPTKEIAPGVKMPVLSIGTGGLEKRDAQEITENWLGQGGRGIDAAYMYRNEDVVGAAIKKSGVDRKDLFITTKIPGCSSAQKNLESNLQQLGVDYVDLVLIHFPSGDCANAWKAMEEFQKSGKAKAIGVSNFKKSDLQKILQVATITPAVNQFELNVLNVDQDTIDYSTKNKIVVEAYSPLGRAGHSGDIADNAVIKSVAANHQVSTYQVAVKWILQHGYILTFQSTSQAHQKEDADIFGFTLTDDEMSKLDGLGQKPLMV